MSRLTDIGYAGTVSRGMRKYLALLVMAVFVAIQVADIAILDAAPLDATGLHSPTNHDQSKQPLDDCAIHCGCHGLHHMGLHGPVAGLAYAPVAAPMLRVSITIAGMPGQGPPVPPPNA